jgi:hypothetical protein
LIFCQECLRSEGEERKESSEAQAMKVEAVEQQLQVRQEVDKANALS